MTSANEELSKILVLMEDCNIKYSNLKVEYYSKGIESLKLTECEEFLNKTLAPKYTKKILRVLERRKYIDITNNEVILLKNKSVNPGRHLDEIDKKFADSLLNDFHDYERI